MTSEMYSLSAKKCVYNLRNYTAFSSLGEKI
jgi:hypothetical protein